MNIVIENTIKQLGFLNTEVFVKQKLTETLMHDVVKYKSEILFFEKKYKMDFQKFNEIYFNENSEENFKKWDDSISWEASIHSLNKAEQLLQSLQNEGLTNYKEQRSRLVTVSEKASIYYKNLQNNNNNNNGANNS